MSEILKGGFNLDKVQNLTKTLPERISKLDDEVLRALVLELVPHYKNEKNDVLLFFLQFSYEDVRKKVTKILEANNLGNCEGLYGEKMYWMPDFDRIDENVSILEKILKKYSEEKKIKIGDVSENISNKIQAII